MKQIISVLSLMLVGTITMLHAQGLQYEYWLDDNYADKVTQTTTSDEIVLGIDVSAVSPGIHNLTFRLTDEEGSVSAPHRYFVYLPDETPAAKMTLQTLEYWIDLDYANHKTTQLSGDESASVLDIDVSALKTGIHLLFVRALNSDGVWGQPYQYAFYIPDQPLAAESDVDYYEYWFDNDYAAHVEVDVKESEVEDFLELDVSALEPGVHTFHVRACNLAGVMGEPRQYLVYMPEEPEVGATPLVGFEYSFNNVTFEEEMDPSDEFEMADFEFDLPDILDVATFDEERCQYTFGTTSVNLQRTTDVNFSIAFVNEAGVWSNPETFMYQEDDELEHEYIDLIQNEILELDKVQYGDYYALKFSITRTGTSYFAADQDCVMEIFKASTGARSRVFSSEELHAVKSIGLSKGDYYAIVHSMPQGVGNTSETVRLLFSSTKQQLIYRSLDVNMDGVFDGNDIDCLTDYLLGKEPPKIDLEAADADGNGEINIADMVYLLNKL